MGLFDWLFGAKDPLAGLRKAAQRQDWAEALSYRDEIDPATLSQEQQEEVRALLTKAGDSLAQLNLEEGLAARRAGDAGRAEEHFELAAGQVCSRELALEIARAQKEQPPPAKRGGRPASAPEAELEHTEGDGLYDPQIAIELISGGYPTEWRPRYERLQGPLLQAVVAAHEGHYQQATALFEKVPKAERDDIYWFELGALHARSRRHNLARKALQQALAANPGHLLAVDTLVRMELAAGKPAEAEKVLQPLLAVGEVPPQVLGLMAIVALQLGDAERAIDFGKRALQAGEDDPEVLVVLAHLLERKGELQQAEGLLLRLGPPEANLHLAEFHLRQGKHLNRVSNLFRTALQKDPQNPRWQLRVAQCSLASGWIDDARPLLDHLAQQRDLPDALKLEVVQVLKSLPDRKG